MKNYPEPPEGLAVEHDGAVLRVRLDRPKRRNALTDEMVLALTETIEAAGSDEPVRVIALSGAGDDFCSGFDLGQRGKGDEKPRAGATQRRMRWQVNRLIPTMLETQTPIVAAAKGWIIGLGLHLVLASDFAVVADDARLRAPFATMGFTPDSGGSWLLPRLAGVARAKEMIMLGRDVAGAQAASWGMVHRAVPVELVDGVAGELVDELASAATVAVGLSKLLIHRGLDVDLERHLADEALAIELSSRSDDFHEHTRARREKRDPKFKGR
ncbi:MAG TPA: enoyl-CoA hydratase-related protein [Candidatus Limnocylindrales bacterium]|nr:enoyl-CoA hydratase-related protein [Candidatus Limnocylindrales bacterium]